MGGRFSFRPVGALDLDLASSVHRESFVPLGERSWTRQDLGELLASPGVSGQFVQIDGQDVGFALYRVVADEAELLTIAVNGDRRRLGAGRALLGTIIALARAEGARILFLEVGVDNPSALALYAQMGFQLIGRRASYYERRGSPRAAALVMRLELTSGG